MSLSSGGDDEQIYQRNDDHVRFFISHKRHLIGHVHANAHAK